MILITLLAAAHASTFVPGITAGADFSTQQPLVGIDAALHPDLEDSWTPILRGTAVWAFSDDRPMGRLEAGLAMGLPHEGEIVRLGAVVWTQIVDSPFRLPIGLSETEDRRLGLIPGAELLVEFEYGERHPFVFGARLGVTAGVSNYLCPTPELTSDCAAWYPALAGGFYGRGQPLDWLYVEAIVGPSPRLTVGVPFGRRPEPAAEQAAATPVERATEPVAPTATGPVATPAEEPVGEAEATPTLASEEAAAEPEATPAEGQPEATPGEEPAGDPEATEPPAEPEEPPPAEAEPAPPG